MTYSARVSSDNVPTRSSRTNRKEINRSSSRRSTIIQSVPAVVRCLHEHIVIGQNLVAIRNAYHYGSGVPGTLGQWQEIDAH